MKACELPTSVTIGGVAYSINFGWMAALDVLAAFRDPELDQEMKLEVMLQILYPQWNEIPTRHIPEAIEKGYEFLDAGCRKDRTKRPALVDWSQDIWLVIPAVNVVANKEVRLEPNIHWWTFFGWYMSIGESLFSSVLRIRQKKATHKKLEKYEEDFYKANREIIDLKKPETAEEKAMKEYILKWL